MLSNNFRLFKETEDKLKKLKTQTGITPNISARIAFFKSIEAGYRYDFSKDEVKPDGTLALNNSVWFGEFEQLMETILREMYPSLNENGLTTAWASHIRSGESQFHSSNGLV